MQGLRALRQSTSVSSREASALQMMAQRPSQTPQPVHVFEPICREMVPSGLRKIWTKPSLAATWPLMTPATIIVTSFRAVRQRRFP